MSLSLPLLDCTSHVQTPAGLRLSPQMFQSPTSRPREYRLTWNRKLAWRCDNWLMLKYFAIALFYRWILFFHQSLNEALFYRWILFFHQSLNEIDRKLSWGKNHLMNLLVSFYRTPRARASWVANALVSVLAKNLQKYGENQTLGTHHFQSMVLSYPFLTQLVYQTSGITCPLLWCQQMVCCSFGKVQRITLNQQKIFGAKVCAAIFETLPQTSSLIRRFLTYHRMPKFVHALIWRTSPCLLWLDQVVIYGFQDLLP